MKTQRLAGLKAALLMPMAVLLALGLMFSMTQSAYASTMVSLHGPHVGASSETFNNESDDGGLSDPVVWHFVLNQLDSETPVGEITVTFQSGGTRTALGRPVGNGQLQHFYVGTPGHDVLLEAFVVVGSSGGKLLLSHVSFDELPPVDPEDPPVDPEDPPVDPEDPPVDPEDPPVVTEDPPVDPEDPPVVTETESTDDEPFLPFTGSMAVLPFGLAGLASMVGYRLRRWVKQV